MSLKIRIQDDMKSAMRAREADRLSALRLLVAAIRQREIDERIELDDSGVITILEKLGKQRKDSLTQYAAAGRQDLAEREAFELTVLADYLPRPLSAEEINAAIQAAIAESEGYTQDDNNQEEPVDEAEDNQPKLHPKPAKPLPAEAGNGVRKSLAAKTPLQYDHAEVAAAGDLTKIKKAMEAVKPIAAKKPENEASLAVRNSGAKPSEIEPPHQTLPKQPNSAKSLAAAVAEAKNSEVAPKPAAKLVRWYIQLGSFSKKENATSLWESLHEQGLPASLDTVQTDKGTSYRLRLGPELDGKKAAAMKARLDKQNIKAILMSE